MLILAHTGGCRAPEVASTLGIAGAAGIALFRPWRRHSVRDRLMGVLAPLLIAAVVTGGACASKTQQTTSRPTTPAKLAVIAPAPNEVTGPDVTLQLRLDGGTVVQRTSGKLSTTEGHIHVTLDGKLVAMPYGLTYDLHGLSPGSHTVQAAFVAIDHAPFKNNPIAAVLFTVRAA
ncbi:MAG TPA: hypothetical protein VFB78_02260 [Acidimicrobiales bacterium]|nr:hypothetical protein [Acidimicrobiales bacterium]